MKRTGYCPTLAHEGSVRAPYQYDWWRVQTDTQQLLPTLGFRGWNGQAVLLSKDGLPPVDGIPTAIEAGRHQEYQGWTVRAESKDGERLGHARLRPAPFRCRLKATVRWSIS